MRRSILCGLSTVALSTAAAASTFTVTNLNDSLGGSLRAAIQAANANPGPDDIVFSVSGTIIVLSNLPGLTDDDTHILGATAPDAMGGPDVVLDCTGLTNGLVINGASGCWIQGLRIEGTNQFGINVINAAASNQIGGSGAREGNQIALNHVGIRMIGLGTDGNTVVGNEIFSNDMHGVALVDGASHNRVGGLLSTERNLIHSNGSDGVYVYGPLVMGSPCVGNQIQGNSIGTDGTGTIILSNQLNGVELLEQASTTDVSGNYVMFNVFDGVAIQAAQNNVVGNNVCSGNGANGVRIGPDSLTTGNVVDGNRIGTDPTGFFPVPNVLDGIWVRDGASGTTISGNQISGNLDDGIDFSGNSPHDNLVVDNVIGATADEMAELHNNGHGVHVHSVAVRTEIRDNRIAGNLLDGVRIEDCGCDQNLVAGNRIGLTNAVGMLPNGADGVAIACSNNVVGGTAPGDGNTIAGNSGWGIRVGQGTCGTGPTSITDVLILGNTIGGSAPNAGGGIWFANGAVDNQAGDDPSVAGAPNAIQANGGPGVRVGQMGAAIVPVGNRLLTNSMSGNGGPGILLIAGGNDMLQSPVVTGATSGSVSGTNTLAGSGFSTLVQVFLADDGEGETFLGQTMVGSGSANWSVSASVPSGSWLVATNTSKAPAGHPDQTSGFSMPFFFGTGTPVCFGDGSGTACPCGNTGGTGQGCANGTGAGGVLTASGTPSVTADTMSLTAMGVINNNGLFFQGNNTIAGGAGSVFGDGLRCCGAGVVRLQVVNPPGTASPATAQMTETATTNGPPGTITAGTKKCYQYWYRDPSTSPCGFQFNLTNAVSVTWEP